MTTAASLSVVPTVASSWWIVALSEVPPIWSMSAECDDTVCVVMLGADCANAALADNRATAETV